MRIYHASIIGLALLAGCTGSSSEPDPTLLVSETDSTPEAPETDSTPEASETDSTPEASETDSTPEASETDSTPEASETDSTPETSETDPTPEASETESTPVAENIYANGFRLVKATNTFGDTVIVKDYEYNFSDNEITITTSKLGEEDEPRISKLYIDESGRLIGGSFVHVEDGTPLSGITTDYDFRYDDEGRVIEHAESQNDVSTFNYINGLLDNIELRILTSVYTLRFAYDAQGVRISSQSELSAGIMQYEYNTAGQRSRAVRVRTDGSQAISHDFGYDNNGNHASTSSYWPSGELFTSDTYTYEASPETVFNHGIMRQQIEAFNETSSRFVR